MQGVSLTHPVLASFLFLSGEFLLHIPCWLHIYAGSFSYTSCTGFIFIWGVSLTRPMLAYFFLFFFSGEFVLHIPYCFCFSLPLSLSLSLSRCGEFLLDIPCWLYFYMRHFLTQCWLHFYLGSFSYTSHVGLIFNWGISLTHPVLALFLSGEFLLHIPCLLIFSFLFLCGVCLTHPMLFLFVSLSLSLFSCGEFLLDIPCWLYFYMGSFLIHPMLA